MAGPKDVSAREAEVLAALAGDRSNAQIARRLHISIRTVESHISSLLRKYGVADRHELAALADVADSQPPGFSTPAGPGTTFVGREQDRAELTRALGSNRLVSLLGPGGVGKTRLALRVAADIADNYPYGGAVVDLVPVRPGFVVAAVAEALQATEQPPQTLADAVLERLKRGRTLLVLDNCEHLLDEVAGLVARILTEATETAVLVTSRERLGVAGERPVQLGPLTLGAEAEQLFRDRAALVAPELADDSELAQKVCAELDGVPLAIELAAARAGSLGPDGLLAALDDRLRLLSGGRGPNERHNSLAQVIGWSYDLLGDDERRLFRRLGVFVGGFDLAAVAGVAPGRTRGELSDLLGRLTDKSLLHRSQHAGTSRWRMLETVRVFALEELKDAYDEVAALHVAWADQLATKLEQRLEAGEEWQREFDLLAPDLRVASGGVRSVARKLAHLTFARRRFLEAREHYLVAAANAADAAKRYDDLRDAADAALVVADGAHAYQLMMRSAVDGVPDAAGYAVTILNRYEMTRPADLPDDRGASLLPGKPGDPGASVLVRVAWAWADRFGIASAEDAVAAARRANQPLDLMSALDAYSTAVAAAGRMREADAASKERMSLAATLPAHDPRAAAEIVDAFHVASTTAIAVGDIVEAVRLAQLIDDPVHGHPYITAPRKVRAYALAGRFEDAVHAADVMWNGWRAAGCPPRVWMASAAAMAALAHGLLGSGQEAVWQARALEIARVTDATDDPGLAAPAAFVEARLTLHRHDTAPIGVGEVVERAFAPFPEPWWIPYAHAAGAELAVVSGHAHAAQYLERAVSENAWAEAVLRRAQARLTGDRDALLEAAGMFRRIGARFEEQYTIGLAR
ncbi:LuxR C-terminal-related transcriptional regulator [Kribbella sp. VKM Ac-2566]|uniref:ATP-binding protein n=1 Tax=Kribbella sp. VKM Ac-2566 TaxID=2512218 RepID=UPI001063D00A|nr:LuxR C-terminal-related transcriptional regulator [Kribbella sp. VKM Ac-2566]TDW83509.1 putative ATPase [Kribbella sp. VKM Ac-2566]